MSNILPLHRTSSITNHAGHFQVPHQARNMRSYNGRVREDFKAADRNIYKDDNIHFSVQKKYVVLQVLGKGSYGVVCSAKDVSLRNTQGNTESLIAIKKITNIFQREILLKRAIRELKFMSLFQGHKNIVNLIDVELVMDKPFDGLYCYQELIDYDLAKVIHSSVQLTEFHVKHFIYQILCGLKYIHSAGVVHRDLKPGNILCTVNGSLKICDFGLARGIEKLRVTKYQQQDITNYVATRWYRAPEIILSRNPYNESIDMWAVGCILGEFYARRPLFMGNDSMHQIYQIVKILGYPTQDLLNEFASAKSWNLMNSNSFGSIPKKDWYNVLPGVSIESVDMLNSLLCWDSTQRLTAIDALNHPLVASVRKKDDEPVCPKGLFDFSYERNLRSMSNLRDYLVAEISSFGRCRK